MSPLLLNVYICDIIYDSRDLGITSYADECTPYAFSQELNDVLQTSKNGTGKLFDLFQSYYFKSNMDKCHLLTS